MKTHMPAQKANGPANSSTFARTLNRLPRPGIIPLADVLTGSSGLNDQFKISQSHDFTGIPARSGASMKWSDCPPGCNKLADGGTPAPATPGPAAPTPAAKPSLALSGDSYNDTAAESHKKISFDVKVPSTLDVKDYALVNRLKGYQKDGSGKYFKVTMYGSPVDFNFPAWQVDSVDADPVYWSSSSGRWNYSKTADGFTATDDPGPALTSEHGAEYAVNFKIGLYKLADVPTTTSGSIAATAISELPWQYSVKVSSTGTFSHPAL